MSIRNGFRVALLLALFTVPALLIAAAPSSEPAAAKQKYTFKRNYSKNDRFQYLMSTSMQFDFKLIAAGDVAGRMSQDNSSQNKGVFTILDTKDGVPIVERFAFDDSCGEVSRRSGEEPKMTKAKYAGKVVVMKKQGGKLTHDLDGPADQRVERIFNSLSDSDSDLYPPKPVSIGEAWDISQRMEQRMLAATSMAPQVSAFCKLKSVKVVDGKPIAELAISLGMIVHANHIEVQLEGLANIDMESGRVMKMDLTGAVSASAGRNVNRGGRTVRVNAVGEGKMEYHQRSTRLAEQRLAGQGNQTE